VFVTLIFTPHKATGLLNLNSHLYPDMKVWELVQMRTHDAANPMPPSGLMDADRLAALDSYFGAGLPVNDAACEPGSMIEGPAVGPEHLPCEVTDTFVAFGEGASGGYGLAADAGNHFECFVFDAPWDEGAQGVGFAPIIDDDRVVHHWILFSSQELDRPSGTSFDCGSEMPRDATFLTGWAPGGQNRLTPEDVGMQLPPPGSKLLLQIHYWNVAGHDDVSDRSGVAMCTDYGREHTSGVHTLGSLQIAIPPRTSEWSTSGTCTPDIDEPVHVLGSGPHMHNLGASLKTEVLRGGSEDDIDMMVNVESWDFNSQTGYATPMVINPGDVIRTTCTYSNPTDTMVYFGDRTEDEMCFNFITAYPAGSLRNATGGPQGLCIDPPE